jgi:hypothetical protein
MREKRLGGRAELISRKKEKNLESCLMSRAVKICLTEELSAWLVKTTRQSASSEKRVFIRALEQAMAT